MERDWPNAVEAVAIMGRAMEDEVVAWRASMDGWMVWVGGWWCGGVGVWFFFVGGWGGWGPPPHGGQ